jgi:hypothetical protein
MEIIYIIDYQSLLLLLIDRSLNPLIILKRKVIMDINNLIADINSIIIHKS